MFIYHDESMMTREILTTYPLFPPLVRGSLGVPVLFAGITFRPFLLVALVIALFSFAVDGMMIYL